MNQVIALATNPTLLPKLCATAMAAFSGLAAVYQLGEGLAEAAGADGDQGDPHEGEAQGIGPQFLEAGASKDDSSQDSDEVRGGNGLSDDVDGHGHGLLREDESGQEYGGHDDDDRELDGLDLIVGEGREE